MATKGKYTPKNRAKYAGDPKNCIYRSSWEKKLMIQFDRREDILVWSSEEISIKYYDEIRGKWRRYFPDFMIKVKTKENKTKIIMIEVKPYKETIPPKTPTKKTNQTRFLKEVYTYKTNMSKFEAAKKVCEERGWEFRVITEKDVNF